MNPPTRSLVKPDCWLKFSTILPDFAAWQARMSHDSAEIAKSLRRRRISYGPDPRQWVEVGQGSGGAPILPVLIHGGYWRALRAEDHRFVLPGLARIGCNIANIEYRLMPSVRMANLVSDVAAALRTIASVFPGTTLLPVGHSAGAHLAVASLRHDPGLQLRVSGVVAISGAFDLSLIARSFLQAELNLTPEEVRRFSIASLPEVPTLLITGTDETAPFQDQADELAMTAAHARRLRVAHCHHMNVLHGCFSGQAVLLPALRNWLSGQDTPSEIEVPIP